MVSLWAPDAPPAQHLVLPAPVHTGHACVCVVRVWVVCVHVRMGCVLCRAWCGLGPVACSEAVVIPGSAPTGCPCRLAALAPSPASLKASSPRASCVSGTDELRACLPADLPPKASNQIRWWHGELWLPTRKCGHRRGQRGFRGLLIVSKEALVWLSGLLQPDPGTQLGLRQGPGRGRQGAWLGSELEGAS